MTERRPYASWHLIYNLDGTFRGYEWALDADGNPRPSQVYAQEGRDEHGLPVPQFDVTQEPEGAK